MKPISVEDLIPGKQLLCVIDTYTGIDAIWDLQGEELTITALDDVMVEISVNRTGVLVKITLGYFIGNPTKFLVIDPETLTRKEKFLYLMSGKVSLE